MARTKQSTQKKVAGASLVRRQLPSRSGKALKRSERAAETTDMRHQTALFPSIYASDPVMLMKARFGAVASQARADMPARVATEVLPPAEDREPTQVPVFDIFVRMGLVPPFSDFPLEIMPNVVAAVHKPPVEGPAQPRSNWSEWNLDDGARQMPSAGLGDGWLIFSGPDDIWLIVSSHAGLVLQLVVGAASSSIVCCGLLRFRFFTPPNLLTCSCRTLGMGNETRNVVGSSRNRNV